MKGLETFIMFPKYKEMNFKRKFLLVLKREIYNKTAFGSIGEPQVRRASSSHGEEVSDVRRTGNREIRKSGVYSFRSIPSHSVVFVYTV